ncbi:hypothetical protein ABFP25_15635 [Acinetobacter indicus]|uniref:hypothetical protein n=1 Tax=Acinetobacter indicus TaxID=756892 RepID=UPI0032126DA9
MKKLVTVILIYIFYFNSITTAYAANVGGWNLSNPVAQGASTVYDATKNVLINGKDFVKNSWVKITPNASQVAKVLARGGAGYALSVAVEQLIGAVDWVLDPANNQIKYYVDNVPDNCSTSSCDQFLNIYYVNNYQSFGYFPSPERAALEDYKRIGGWQDNWSNPRNANCTVRSDGSTYDCTYTVDYQGKPQQRTTIIRAVANPNYDPEAEREQKTLPLETVAAQVISNAESDTDKRAAAQVATTAAAADIVNEAETDDTKARPIANQAEANAETKPADPDAAAGANSGSATATPQADPVTGQQAPPTDISLEFPIFCNWAPTVCQAAQVVISFPQTLTGWWESANQKADQWVNSISEAWQQVRDYFKEEAPPNDSTEVEFVEPVPPVVDAPSFSWNAYCPFSARTDQISVDGNTVSLESDLTSWCEMAVEVRPFILFAGAWISYLIISGFRMGGD